MSTPILYDILSQKLEQKRDNHPSFKLMKIDNSLFPNGIIIPFETEAKDSDNKLRTVKDIVAESWKKGEKNHLMIQGEGGIGKTVTLLSLPVMFDDYTAPAIYIPLHELKGGGTDDMIESYIKKRVLDDDEELFRQLKKLRKTEWENGPSLLLLLDGFNEIPIELRGAISENIEQWSEYSGIQLITSSRFDIHQYVYLRSSFSKIELQPLSEDTVLTYLENNGIDTPKSSAITKLITIPLLLTLYIKTETIRREQPAPFTKFLETKNVGSLIWNYLQSELRRFKNQDLSEAKACVLAMELIAPYIAWTMQKQSEFILDESVFLDRIDEAYDLMETHYANKDKLPPHIKTTLQKSKGLPDSEYVGLLLSEHLGLFVGFKEKDKHGNDTVRFKLMHQQFRDALAAMHLINSIYLNGNIRPTEWNSTVDHYVMQFVADLISEEEANRLWNNNRTSAQLESATRNQLELQRRLHDCDFSKLDFSGLDLSNISLYPYRVSNVLLKLPTNADAMDEVKISEKTFSSDGHKSSVDAIAETHDGRYIVSGSRDNTIRIWDLDSGECIKTLKGHGNGVKTIAVTPNGRNIVSGSHDKTIRVWDWESGEVLIKIKGHKDSVFAIAVTPDGRHIVSGSRDKTIRIWDLENRRCIKTLEGHWDGIKAITLTPNGKCIISGSYDKTIRIWDLENGTCVKMLKGHGDGVRTVAVTPDSKQIISGSDDNTIRIWDLKSGECLKTLKGHEDLVCSVAVTPDNRHIVSGSADNFIRIWDIKSGECIKILKGHGYGVKAVAVSLNGRHIFSGSRDNTIRIWDFGNGECIKMLEVRGYWVNAITVTPDGRHIVSGSDDNSIRIWDLEGRESIKAMEGHRDWVRTVAVTPDGKYIISGSYDKTIRIWDIENGTCIKMLEGHGDWVRVVAVTPDGKHIVSGSYDKTIRVWNLESGICLKTLKGHGGGVDSVTVTPNGKHIISGSRDNSIRIWNLKSGKCIKTLKGLYDGVDAVMVTPDSGNIVSGSRDNIIRIWNLKSGKCIKTLKGHMNWVRSIAITSNGRYIVSGSWDRNIRIWDLEKGMCIKTFKVHGDWVNAIALTPDCMHIISGSVDGTICIINIETNEVRSIHILPISFIGLDFSKAIISTPELEEQLRQNGAKV